MLLGMAGATWAAVTTQDIALNKDKATLEQANFTVVTTEASTTFTPGNPFTNIFQYKPMQIEGEWQKIIIEFDGTITSGWNINLPDGSFHDIINDSNYDSTNNKLTIDIEGITEYGDFTIFNWDGCTSPITIKSMYFWKEDYVYDPTQDEDPDVTACPAGWTDMITNGNLSGNDVSSFYVGSGTDNAPVEVNETAGRAGGHGIKITSKDNATKNWDTQFWLVAKEAMSAGTKVHIAFDYRASKAVKIETQFHATPGNFLYGLGDGNKIDFKTKWNHYEKEFMLTSDNVQSFTLNLNEIQDEAIDFYFDNLEMWAKPNAIEKPNRTATDAKVISLNEFKSLGGSWVPETKTFTGNCGFLWEEGLDLSQYRYLVITLGQNTTNGNHNAYIKDKNGKIVEKDEYGADFMNMWFGEWNNHNCMKIDLEKLRMEKEFDIYHIAELGINGENDGLILSNVYASNQEPGNSKNWNGDDNGDFKFGGLTADKFGTVCLPYQAAIAAAKVYEIASASESGISLVEHEGLLEAGKPYIYQTVVNKNATKENTVYFYKATAATVTDPVANNGLVGTFAETKAPTDSWVLSGNKLYTVDSDVTIGANKAWIVTSEVTNNSARGTKFISFDEATGIKAVSEALNAGKMYDLSGREVAEPAKGIYVVNGKKVIIK